MLDEYTNSLLGEDERSIRLTQNRLSRNSIKIHTRHIRVVSHRGGQIGRPLASGLMGLVIPMEPR